MADVAFLGVGELGRAYRARELSPREVVAGLLARVEAFEPQLNAFARLDPEAALAAAETAERELAAGHDRGPLHGVPVALKDLVDVAGVPTRCGSPVTPAEPAAADAEIVTRLRRAGAVLLGKTQLLEFAYGVPHPEVGATRNPWDPGRTAGGSSGGSAAATAAGLVPLAVGTDTGGSIRIPAAYCGVVGLKPSYGRVPAGGVFPLSWSLDHVGPLARDCDDAAALFAVLAGEPPAAVGAGELRGARVGIARRYGERVRLEPGVEARFADALATLEGAGARLVEVDLDGLELANEALLALLLPEASVIHERYMTAGASGYAPATRAQLELGFALPATFYLRAQQARRTLVERAAARMADLDLLVTPSVPWVAPAEDPAIDDPDGHAEMHFSGPFNLLGWPALSLPWGLAEGLPVGVQLVAGPGRDADLLAYGAALERLRGAAPRPTPVGKR